MIRMLFVDDEPRLLSAMQNRLRRQREVWDMRFADSPAAALDELARVPADVVVTDQNMPGMRGTELLEQVRADHPQALRVLLSGQCDGAGVSDGLRLAHQYLVKPCNVDDLVATVNHLMSLRSSFASPHMQRVIHAVDRLPTPKAVFQELSAALADPDADLKKIAAIIERDPGLSLKLLKLANSAFYASTPVSQVLKAVQRLGLSLVRSAVTYAQLAGSLEASLPGCAGLVEQLQQRALLVGKVAAKLVSGEAVPRAYLAGLLHDVGGLVLLVSLPEHREALFTGVPWAFERAAREKQLLGFTHADVGAYLLGTWGLSASLVRAVASQHAPERASDAPFDAAGAVHVAQRLAMEEGSKDLKSGPKRADYDFEYLTACGQSLPALTERAFGRDTQ
ncbi:MAG: HDOD domain-containing protein [Myxococcaceae bacterium]|nr:HDOD domain-containing protein [Myxococcaceae bacterium]